jgi:hypothetical protein
MLKIMYNMFSMVAWHDEVCKTERGGGLFWGVSPHLEAMGTERLDQGNTYTIWQGEKV